MKPLSSPPSGPVWWTCTFLDAPLLGPTFCRVEARSWFLARVAGAAHFSTTTDRICCVQEAPR